MRPIKGQVSVHPGDTMHLGDSVGTVFSGLFPELLPSHGVCSCGRRHDSPDSMSLPVYEPVPDDVLAEQAARSPVVRQAVSLATWLGEGRPVTVTGVLRLADAEQAVDELGLDDLVLPIEDGDDADDDADDDDLGDDDLDVDDLDVDDLDDDDFLDDDLVRPLTAEEIPALHAVWTAALESRLIDVRDGMAYQGTGLEVWQGAASSTDRIEAWATLTAAYVRSWAELGEDSLLAVTAPLLYATAHRPVKVGALAAGMLELDDDDDDDTQIAGLPSLVEEVGFALEDWAVCGVITAVPAGQESAEGGSPNPADVLNALAAELREQVRKVAVGENALMRAILEPVINALDHGPHVQLTPLGRYGLARLLAAHHVTVPTLGDCADVDPDRLLDRLLTYLPQNALEEARLWLDARGDEWESALREVASTAAVKDAAGPPRRTVLAVVLSAAGPRVAPLLDDLDADEWLTVTAAMVRHRLGLGPELTVAQRLWTVVDGLTLTVDDLDEFESAVHDLRLCELLRRPDGVQAAAELSHPRAREMLMLSTRYLGDAELARQLRRALGGDVRQSPVRRAVGGARRSRKRRS